MVGPHIPGAEALDSRNASLASEPLSIRMNAPLRLVYDRILHIYDRILHILRYELCTQESSTLTRAAKAVRRVAAPSGRGLAPPNSRSFRRDVTFDYMGARNQGLARQQYKLISLYRRKRVHSSLCFEQTKNSS